MSDLKLFRLEADGAATELRGKSIALEKQLQNTIEKNMTPMFGVRFLASEYSTGVKHGGRIDSLGIDEDGSPVIFEYKRSRDENVINQGLFYLDWLMDHRAEFQILVMNMLGREASEMIDGRNPRLVCIANSFTKFDEHAVAQINRSIELVRYRDFEGELLALELITATKVDSGTSAEAPAVRAPGKASPQRTVTDLLAQASPNLQNLYSDIDAFLSALGDDVNKKTLKYYFAYRRLKNFACVEVHPHSKEILMYLKLDPSDVASEDGFIRDVSQIGHFGTGDLEVRIKSYDDFVRAQPLIQQAYDAN